MGYIGPSPNPGQNREVDDISSGFNGSEVNFTLQVSSQNVSPGSSNAIIVSLGGVVQNPGTDYTVAASTLTFTTAPASGLSFFGLVLGQQVDTEGFADGGTLNNPVITGDLSIADKIVHTGDTNTAIRFPSADNVRIDTGGSNRFKIVSDGRIGILDPNLDNFDSSADDLVINGSANTGITINSGGTSSTAEGALVFAEGNGSGGSADAFRGAIQYKHGDDRMMFYTNNTERMRIHNSNQVQIGGTTLINSSPYLTLGQSANSQGNIVHFINNGTADLKASYISAGKASRAIGIDVSTDNFFIGRDSSDKDIVISNDGFVAINKDTGLGSQFEVESNASTREPMRVNDSNNTNADTHRISFRTGGTEVGKISSTRSGTSFGTSSDYRLKENVVAISDGISRLKTLSPKRFNFIVDETNTLVDGFLAHEVTAVPEAISGTKDAVITQAQVDSGLYQEEELGNPIHQTIDQSKLVPLLVAAVQEAITKIETLETKVAALEAA